MFTIGEFATLGRVSIRMLRHYDQIGLLPPARVDEFTGYRYYAAEQLQQLNRLVALKDLGFTLNEVARIIDAKVDAAELRGMLRLRRAQVAEQIAADTDRLVRIEARLRMIEREGAMSTSTVTTKSVDPVCVATMTATADSSNHEDVGPVIQALFGRLFDVLADAGVEPAGLMIATYAPAANDRLTVTAACPVGAETSVDGVDISELDGLEQVACYLHEGEMVHIGEGYQALATWIEDNGYRTDGTAREVYIVSSPEPEAQWRTELQMPILHS